MRKALLSGLLIGLAVTWVTDAGAITAWSRKYGTEGGSALEGSATKAGTAAMTTKVLAEIQYM